MIATVREQVAFAVSDSMAMEGSGFFVPPPPEAAREDAALLVTSAHTVSRGGDEAPDICVRLYDDREPRAELWCVAPELDLALLWVPGVEAPGLPLRPLQNVEVGERVVAIGSPFGYEGMVTSGIISAIDRPIATWHRYGRPRLIENCLVTDALSGPGNSGGPLIGIAGDVLGVNIAVHRDGEGVGSDPSGLGFAVPATLVEIFMHDAHHSGRLARGTLRLCTEVRDLTQRERDCCADQAVAVAVVAEPEENSPGHGVIRRHDLLLRLDGHELNEAGEIMRLLDEERTRRTVELDLVRDSKRLTVQVKPVPRG